MKQVSQKLRPKTLPSKTWDLQCKTPYESKKLRSKQCMAFAETADRIDKGNSIDSDIIINSISHTK